MKYFKFLIPTVIMCMVGMTTCNYVETVLPDEAELRRFDYPGTDIWGTSLASPGFVSDLGEGYMMNITQTRQLPSWRAGDLIFGVSVNSRYHSAVVDSYVYNGETLIGYWMEGVESLRIKLGDTDTTLVLAPCRFFAGLDSYPSMVGYKQWHRRDSTNKIPKVMPTDVVYNGGKKIPVYSVGDTLSVRADESLDHQSISRWWIGEDGTGI
jgi:hypothetical protein